MPEVIALLGFSENMQESQLCIADELSQYESNSVF